VDVEIIPPTPVSCPPHYWLIQRLSLHIDYWTCHRCGAEEEHETPVIGFARRAHSSRLPKST
jgi:hypothetical protein